MQSAAFSIAILVKIQHDENSKGPPETPLSPGGSPGESPDNFRRDNISCSHGIMKNRPKAETISILSVALSYERTTLEVTKFD